MRDEWFLFSQGVTAPGILADQGGIASYIYITSLELEAMLLDNTHLIL